jgi:hypothetical protein
MVLGALASGQDLPTTAVTSSKATSSGWSKEDSAGTAVRETSIGQPHAGLASAGSSFREQTHPQAHHEAFNEFADGDRSTLPIENTGNTLTDPDTAGHLRVDGSEVVDLLSHPEDVDTEMWQTNAVDVLSNSAEMSLREALFAAKGETVRWDHLLNFTPSFIAGTVKNSHDAQLYFGTADEETVRSLWLSQWDRVLSAYSDEVWGDLAPLANDARRQIEVLTAEDPPVDHSAANDGPLGRLRMILAHVRGSD